nr:replication protein A 70 kDa DNA-binding subunit B [Tanacetum cinerariifolium]
MATFISGYISDLPPVKDNIKLRVRILRAWLQPLYNNQQVKNMEMIVMDEHDCFGTAICNDEVLGWLFANQPSDESENTATKISTASKNSTNDTFVNKHPIRNIVELLDAEHGVQSVIVGTVITIQEDEGWWYLGCKACRGKVIKSTDYIDLESEIPKNWMGLMIGGAKSAVLGFRLQIRVQDETGTMSLSLFNDEVAIDDYNVKKLFHVFTVLRFSNEQEIINSVLACATPIKDNEATSNTVMAITSLDLESQTDENTTPNEKQKTNTRPAEGEPGSESSTGKKKAVEIKVKKDA